ncbi:thiamine biosynthesis protein [unidentified eubacterium SCB49]|nr:thiamine biosynthesis protein [unidentified eubacterium SCB49]
MSFSEQIKQIKWDTVKASIYNKTANDVAVALSKTKRDLEDFKALISPAAQPYLEQMAQLSNQLTQKRFGKTIQMYIPMYLSNECQNICTYCGFSLNVDITRKTLTDAEIITEAKIIKNLGYDHILLVTGEANKTVGVDYFVNAIRLLKPFFAHIAIEVQPLDQEEYETLIDEGINTVLVYQETYKKDAYKKHHPKGKKSNFEYRLKTHDRLGKAGIYKMGLGVLFGLEDWRVDTYFCASHLSYLEKTYWKSKYSISFPRLRPCAGGIELKSVMSDKELVQLICAYRIFNEEVELSISTRESERFRDHIIKLGITSASADSKTDPGGYANPNTNLEQFEIDDTRPTKTFIEVIKNQGYDPVFKDWDSSLQ